MKLGAAILFAAAFVAQAQAPCSVIRHGSTATLHSPSFEFSLDTAQELKATAWKNLSNGRVVSLGGGPEVELDFDAADKRVWISGWKESQGRQTTHLFIPLEAKGRKLTLTLGGFGLYDYGEIDIEWNGKKLASRTVSDRWHEPGQFLLPEETVRFGQDNILVMECRKPILETERMRELGVDIDMPYKAQWPAQFEQYVTIGTPLSTPRLKVVSAADHSQGNHGRFEVNLQSDDADTSVSVTYDWTATEPVLRKHLVVHNLARNARRLMHVRLGNYPTDSAVSDGEQGFPVYLGEDRFMSLAHPSGWAIGQHSHVLLRQYPGQMLAPGSDFESMEAVYGVGESGGGRDEFLRYLQSRSRRVLRHHDKPYSIYETFGADTVNGREVEDGDLTESYIMDMLRKLERGQKESGYSFDFCSTEFWLDYAGDMERFDPVRYPNGFTNIKAKLDELGIKPALWIDSSWRPWTISKNPVVGGDFTHDRAYEDGVYGMASLCRAVDPIRTMYSTAFAYHMRVNGVRLIKCDNLHAMCRNPNHSHLPGVYSTEAIHNGVIQTMRDWDAVNPDVFIMLYWGYRSPWWMLYGDTVFESGFHMEAATPGPTPTLYGRDGVTVRLDQGQWWRNDMPPLGKDTLGVWLSDWSWNSHMGKDKWEAAFAMDLCRGSMLAQIWTDYNWLSPPEHKELAEFINLLKARPGCFGNPRFILGNPWKSEPYGYACPDGREAFIAVNNCTWTDAVVRLELNAQWGLTNSGPWDLYRWYPDPAKLVQDNPAFQNSAALALRPFEVALLEVVPQGQAPALPRNFAAQPLVARFDQPTESLPLSISPTNAEKKAWNLAGAVSSGASGTLVISAQSGEDGGDVLRDAQTRLSCRAILEDQSADTQPVLRGPGYPARWQAWRIPVQKSAGPKSFRAIVSADIGDSVKLKFKARFIPADESASSR